jgi:hypothetical protein
MTVEELRRHLERLPPEQDVMVDGRHSGIGIIVQVHQSNAPDGSDRKITYIVTI